MVGVDMANTFTVTNNTDNGTVADGSIGTAATDGSNDASGTLRQAVNYANATAGPVIIDFALPAGLTTISLVAPLQPILNSVTINGNGATIVGNGTRIFFVGVDAADMIASTNFASRLQVGLNDLTLADGLAQGGAGGNGSGGGGLGAGGAIFVNQSADVALTDVSFANDEAKGGNGGGGDIIGGGGGLGGAGNLQDGGGGLYGDGGNDSGGGVFGNGGGLNGGGGGYSGNGGDDGQPGAAGTLFVYGLNGSGGSGFAEPGGINGGGGGSDPGSGGGGGFGGKAANTGGNGGFGGGAGDSGTGGFGGGGGQDGNGGFGGGGGAFGVGGFGGGGGGGNGFPGYHLDGGYGGGAGGAAGGSTDVSGFGASAAAGNAGGGGAAMGGSIFVASGGTVSIDSDGLSGVGSLSGGMVSGGKTGGTGAQAESYGTGIFYQGGAANNPSVLDVAGAGSYTIGDDIADQSGSGSGATAGDGFGGSGGVTGIAKSGTGTLILSGDNTYSGGTTLGGGTLELANNDGAGSGPITFGASAVTLRLDQVVPPLQVAAVRANVVANAAMQNNTFADPLASLAVGDAIDLRGLAYVAGSTTATESSDKTQLIVTDGLASETFTLENPSATMFTTARDAGDGTLVTAVSAPVQGGGSEGGGSGVGTPVANAQTTTTAANTADPITLTGTDPDSPALPLTYAITTQPTDGTLSNFNAATGAVTYTPNTGYIGPDSFAFTDSNGTNTSAPATVGIAVRPRRPTTALACLLRRSPSIPWSRRSARP